MSSDSADDGQRYAAFLIRFWRDSGDSGWRASAQSVYTGKTVYCASLKALFGHIAVHLGDPDSQIWPPQQLTGGDTDD